MSVLSDIYVTTMENGQKWGVPVGRIAYNRAHYYAKNDGISFDDSLKNDTIPLFESDAFEIEDWAQNNMNWSDVESCAFLISDAECCFQEGWCNGDHEIISGGVE